MEIMLVVGIIGLIMAASVPSLYQLLHREGFRKTVSDIQEICEKARRDAIIGGQPVALVLYPLDRRCQLGGENVEFGNDVTVEMLDVNLSECKDEPEVSVMFFPGGTSDELTIFLRSDKGERRRISLEITTALPIVEAIQ